VLHSTDARTRLKWCSNNNEHQSQSDANRVPQRNKAMTRTDAEWVNRSHNARSLTGYVAIHHLSRDAAVPTATFLARSR
jgi:hypothetical protein